MKPSVTPLRYPGGKTWLLPYVKDFLNYHNIHLGVIVEPFAGSASVSIGLLNSGFAEHAYICDSDPLIIAFWRSIFNNNAEFIESVKNLEITMETWYDFKKYLDKDAIMKYRDIELGLAFLFYNRTNFSGIIIAGPIGGKRQLSKYKLQCRFNMERIIKKIQKLSSLSDRVTIELSNGIDFLKNFGRNFEEDHLFFYIDPPYYNGGNVLYRNYFRDKEHVELANVLSGITEYPWLVSYDNAEFIKNLYSESRSQYVYTDYQAGNLKRGMRELLLSNLHIPPKIVDTGTAMERSVKIKNDGDKIVSCQVAHT